MNLPSVGRVLLAVGLWAGAAPLAAQDNVIGLQPQATPTPSTVQSPAAPAGAVSSAVSAASARDLLENLGEDRPWMGDLYSWDESYDLDRQGVDAQRAGAYCVGNGHSFTLIGLESPLWDWSDLYGDSYQEPDLGHVQMTLVRDGAEVRLARQQIGWVRRSGLVRVTAEGNGLRVETYDFAPCQWNRAWADNPAALVRLVHVVNEGSAPETALGLRFKVVPAWNVQARFHADGGDLLITQPPTKAKRRTYWRLAAFDPRGASAGGKALETELPALPPGGEAWTAYFLGSSDSPEEGARLAARLRSQGAAPLLDDTRDYYQKWFAQGAEFSGDPKVADLFEIQSLIFKCEESHSGGFSPLVGYSYTWIRDNNGPIRWFLKTGHVAEAKGAIDFFHGVAASMGSLPNSIRVDYPLTYRLKDLSGIHVEHAETPNWIVLQHWWYYLATGDLDTIRQRWAYLKRCLTGQVQEDGKFFFHRDETYLWCLESRCFDHESYPNYDLSTYAFAVDSSFDFVAAADRLAALGGRLGWKVGDLQQMSDAARRTAEQTYWNAKDRYWAPAQSLLGPLYNAPYANILLNPFWCGYARNDLDPAGETPEAETEAKQALTAGYQWLGKPDGFWKTTPGVPFFVGMNPGQLLVDLCKARLPWAGKAYQDVLELASPSGDYSEMYDGRYQPWNPPAWGQGTSGRVRPWEGGLDTESLLEFLTGFAPDAGEDRVVFAPHLPEKQDAFSADRLPVGDARVSLEMKRLTADRWQASFRLDEGKRLMVTLDLWPTDRKVDGVDTEGPVEWDKRPDADGGTEARLTFALEAGIPRTFTVRQGGGLPAEDRDPPAPQRFEPAPYATDPADLLLVTSPTALFLTQGHVPAENFLKVGREELVLARRVTPSVSFLDLDLPLAPSDIADALVDAQGNPKVKLAVLGRGALAAGKHDFKTESFWADPKLGEAVRRFLEAGGNLIIGPSYLDREVQPDWLVRLTGGWREGDHAGQAVAPAPAGEKPQLQLLDEIDVANDASEAGHQCSTDGAVTLDRSKLPELPRLTKMLEDDGRVFKGYYQFSAKTEPGLPHRVWVRVNNGFNTAGTALLVKTDGGWVQAGVRTKNSGTDRDFLTFYFEVPAPLIGSDHTLFRLADKGRDPINAYHLWVFGLNAPDGRRSLAQALGFQVHQTLGRVDRGLIPLGGRWEEPLQLAEDPSQAALLAQRIGKGWLIRSQLNLGDSQGLMTALLHPGPDVGPSPTASAP